MMDMWNDDINQCVVEAGTNQGSSCSDTEAPRFNHTSIVSRRSFVTARNNCVESEICRQECCATGFNICSKECCQMMSSYSCRCNALTSKNDHLKLKLDVDAGLP